MADKSSVGRAQYYSLLGESHRKPPYTAFTVAEWVPQYGRDLLAAELVSLQTCGFTTTTLAITLEAFAEDAAAKQIQLVC